MQLRSLVLVLFLTSCASGPSEFHKGATPTRAPGFNPATDAPHTVGQPGHLRPEALPRSPHTRVLPQTPETYDKPGLWSAESPEASLVRMWKHRQPVALGIRLPGGEDSDEERLRDLTRQCAYHIDTLGKLHGPPDLANLTDAEKQCLVARLYQHCASGQAKAIKREADAGRLRAAHTYLEAALANIRNANAMDRAECSGASEERVKSVFWRITENWK